MSMRIKASKRGDLIIIRFDKVKNLRYGTFRFAYYGGDWASFCDWVKDEDTKAFFCSTANCFKHLPKDITNEERKIYEKIKELSKGNFGKYSVILYPECEKIIAFDHELCHYFCRKFKTYRKKVFEILKKKAYKIKVIKKHIMSFGYDAFDAKEEIVAYCSSEPYCNKIKFRHRNEGMIQELIELFQEYKNKHFYGE
jgi:hypothetical protein